MLRIAPKDEDQAIFDASYQGNVALTLELINNVSQSPEKLEVALLQALKGASSGVSNVSDINDYCQIVENVFSRRVLREGQMATVIVQSDNHSFIFWAFDKSTVMHMAIVEALCREKKWDWLSELIGTRENSFSSIAYGVATSGDLSMLQSVLSRGANKDHALVAAFKWANTENINYLSSIGAKLEPHYLAHILSFSFSSTKKLLETNSISFLSHIDNEALRLDLIRILKGQKSEFDELDCQAKTALWNGLMRKAGMTFEQAQEYSLAVEKEGLDNDLLIKKAIKVMVLRKENRLTLLEALAYLRLNSTLLWLQKGLCSQSSLPIELYHHVLSFVIDLPWLQSKIVAETPLVRCGYVKNSMFHREKELVVNTPQEENKLTDGYIP